MTEEHLGASRILGPDACRKILLCGELNPYGVDCRYALYHEPPRAAGGRLMRIIGLQARQFYLPLWRTNLCTGDWNDRDAIRRAKVLLDVDVPWSVIVLLGVKVGKAFAHANGSAPSPFDHQVVRIAPSALTLVSLPHPSGRNAASWTVSNIDRARNVMREVAPTIPWGELA